MVSDWLIANYLDTAQDLYLIKSMHNQEHVYPKEEIS